MTAGPENLVITGIGVLSAAGQGQREFAAALMDGRQVFGVMQRAGRQKGSSAFLGAEIPSMQEVSPLPGRRQRKTSLSGQAALLALREAWEDARLADADPCRIGLVIGGSNMQQRELALIHDSYRERLHFLKPSYGIAFMDTDLCGHCTEQFGIRGFACTVGGASASGHMAVIQAAQAVQSGVVDICIALGALMDLSYWECYGFRALGAMGSDAYAAYPNRACRPFDRGRDGFIYGECCGAVVVERLRGMARPGVTPYAFLSGWAMAADGNRNPDPSFEGEVLVIRKAMQAAGFSSADIDYVNPHGSGSKLGDETEIQALRASGLAHARVNATKSITGHGLSAAGTVELIATLLQMLQQRLHPTLNLEHPIDPGFSWVRETAVAHDLRNALNLSFGFGGINTAICLKRYS